MLKARDLGELLYNTRERLYHVEVQPILNVNQLIIKDDIKFLSSSPNTIGFFDKDNYLISKKASDLITGTDNQIYVQENTDGTLLLSTPQDLDLTASPIFSGLNIAGDINISGNVDGVDVSAFYTEYGQHVSNSTTAHFGQNLTISGEPIFKSLELTSTID